MTTIEISKTQARRFLINYQGLDNNMHFNLEEGILKYIERVGCIQYDPLNVVGRNADLVLQSRIQGYKAHMLEELLYQKRSLIDGWDKMMAIYLTKDLPFLKRVRENHIESTVSTMRKRGTLKALELTEEVKNIIKEEGPKLAREINIGVTHKRGRWGHGKLSSVALDYLYNCGELAIHSKQGTQKVYDIVGNIIDLDLIQTQDPFKCDREFYKWYVKRRIGSIGMIWGRNGGGWLGHFLSNKKLRSSIIDELLKEQSLVSVKVKGIDEPFYLRTEDEWRLKNVSEYNFSSMRILAPLDNLLWDRAMLEEIFGFSYTWEVYIPKEKRKFGYYVLPILCKDRFVARFEPEKHRGNRPLSIKNWWWEEGVIINNEIKENIDNCLIEFCNYLDADGLDKGSMEKIYS